MSQNLDPNCNHKLHENICVFCKDILYLEFLHQIAKLILLIGSVHQYQKEDEICQYSEICFVFCNYIKQNDTLGNKFTHLKLETSKIRTFTFIY